MIGIDPFSTTSASTTSLGLGVLVTTVGTASSFGGSPTHELPEARLSEQVRPWESTLLLSGITEAIDIRRWQAVLTQFAERLTEGTIDPVPEFDAVITEHFWDLA